VEWLLVAVLFAIFVLAVLSVRGKGWRNTPAPRVQKGVPQAAVGGV